MNIRTVPDWLQHQTDTRPTQLAIDDGVRQVSFQSLDEEAWRYQAGLIAREIAPGDRVVLVARPHVASLAFIHAVMRQRAILVPLDPNLTEDDFHARITDSAPVLVVSDGSARIPVPNATALDDLPVDSPRDRSPEPIDLHRIAVLVYTSGTTGVPKAAQIRVGNFFWSALFGGLHMGIHPDDCWLFVMPLFHVSGLSIIFRSVIHGSSIRIRVPFSVATTRDVLRTGRVSLTSWVPTMLWRLLEDGINHEDVPSLRIILLGGAPSSPDLITQSRDRGLPVVPTYGLTETCSQVVTGLLHQVDEEPGSSGRPIFPTQIRIVDDSQCEVPPEHPGEILVNGPTVFAGYWNNPDASARAFTSDGWLRTHDFGRMSKQGWLTVIDRLGDLIIRGGENISPTEVEHAIMGYPGVQDVAVVGIPDREWGEVVGAVLVSPSPINRQTLTNFLQRRLARYKIPTVYFHVDALPRTPSGKIQRRHVRNQIESHVWVPLPD